jgi:hypothetical protein
MDRTSSYRYITWQQGQQTTIASKSEQNKEGRNGLTDHAASVVGKSEVVDNRAVFLISYLVKNA